MRKDFSYYFLIILLVAGVSTLQAQDLKLDRWVIGSGGSVATQNSGNWKMSGMAGQAAIETIKATIEDDEWTVHQGFWVPVLEKTSVEGPSVSLTPELANFPNPFSYTTTIKYNLPGTSSVTIRIYDLVGNLVRVLVNGSIQDAGQQEVVWDAKDESGMELGSGSYMYELNVVPAQMAGNPGYGSYNLRSVMVIVK